MDVSFQPIQIITHVLYQTIHPVSASNKARMVQFSSIPPYTRMKPSAHFLCHPWTELKCAALTGSSSLNHLCSNPAGILARSSAEKQMTPSSGSDIFFQHLSGSFQNMLAVSRCSDILSYALSSTSAITSCFARRSACSALHLAGGTPIRCA